MNQIKNMDMDYFNPQEKQSKNLGKATNFIAIIAVFSLLEIAYHLEGPSLIVMAICCLIMGLMGVDYAIGIILTYWFLVPADMINYMFVSSGAGNYPIYILLIVFFIIIQFVNDSIEKNASFARIIDRKAFIFFLSLFFVFACTVLAYLMYDSRGIISNAVKFFAQTLGMLILIRLKRFTQEDVNNILHYLFILTIIVNIIAVAEQGFGFNIYDIYGVKETSDWYEYVRETHGTWRVKSTFGNALIFSTTMVMCLPMVEYFRRTENRAVLDIVRVGILLLGSVLSGSRSGTAIIAIYLIYYFFSSKRNRKLLLLCILPLAIIIFMNFVDFSLLIQRTEYISSDTSLSHRLSAYSTYFKAISLSPIWGVGLGNTYNVLNNYISGDFVVNTLDNTFMDLSLAVGWLGFACIIIMIYEVVSITVDKNKKHIMNFSIIMLILISFFLNASKYQTLWGIFWMYILLFSDLCGDYKLNYHYDEELKDE